MKIFSGYKTNFPGIMIVRALPLIFFLQLNFPGFSQTDSTAVQKFIATFLTEYKELSKPPVKNYYKVLSNSAKLNFTVSNPFFLKALTEISQKYKVEERAALDSLFTQTFTYLKNNSIWISNNEIYKTQKQLFDIYINSLCPCLASKIKRTDLMQKMLTAIEGCSSALIKDSAFITRIKAKAGQRTLDELYDVNPYLAIYTYQNCELLNYKWNETILLAPVHEQYFSDLSVTKTNEAERAIKYFKTGQFDSLVLIFPQYKDFTDEFDKIVPVMNQPDITIKSVFIRNMEGNMPKIIITILKNTEALAEITMLDSSIGFNSIIKTVNFDPNIVAKDTSDVKIIEAKVAVPPADIH